MRNQFIKLAALLLFMLPAAAGAAVCTSLSAGNWSTAGRWSCGHVPLAADTVVIAHNVILNNNYTVAGLTVNAGATLDGNGGSVATVTGDVTVDGMVSNGARINVTGAASVISGTGTFSSSRLYTSGAAVTIAAGSSLNFTGTSRLYAGRTEAGATVAGSVLTINGTLNSTVTTATTFLRLYANSTVVGTGGAINAGVSAASYNNGTATLTNNGSVSLNQITQSAGTNSWTQGANSSLTLAAVSTVGTLNASAAGNTVTYTAPATPIAPSGNTYYNLGGSGVTCPHSFTVLGTDPCPVAPGSGSVISSPTSCTSVTGVGTVPWLNPANAAANDAVYATALMLLPGTSNYLNCTGYNFAAVPTGATITGITVTVKRKASRSGRARDAFVYLIKDVAGAGVIQTAFNGKSATTYTTADVLDPHGGLNNLWGTTWTDADVKAANFGVAFAASTTRSLTMSVDHIQVQVHYSTSLLDHVLINAPATAMALSEVPVAIAPHTAAHVAYAGGDTIVLSTTPGAGDWTRGTGIGTLTPGTAGSGQASYTFGAGESSVTLGFISQIAGTVTLNVADVGGRNLLLNTPAAEKANIINFTMPGYAFTSGPCTSGTAIGTSPCLLVALSPQVAGQNSGNVYVTLLDKKGVPARNVSTKLTLQFGLTCHDPLAHAGVPAAFATLSLPLCQANGAQPTVWSTVVSFPQNSVSVGPYVFNYADVGKVELWVSDSTKPTPMLGSSGAFVVKPAGFVLSEIKPAANPSGRCAVNTTPAPAVTCAADATGNTFVKAGEAFTATVTAISASGAATPNYGKEVAPESVKLTPALVAGLGLTNNPPITCGDATNAATCDTTTTPGANIPKFGAFNNGAATGANFAWDEVGIITLAPHVADANYLGGGDVVGAASGNVGRFSLGKFGLQNITLENRADLCQGGYLVADATTPCAPAYTYMGEQIDANFMLVPKSLHGAAVQNYVDSAAAPSDFAKLDPTSFAGLNLAAVDTATAGGPYYLTARISNASMPAASCGTVPCFQSGTADVTVPFAFTRNATADGVYDAVNVGIAFADSDGAPVEGAGAVAGLCNNPNTVDCHDLDTDATAGNDRALLGVTEFRHGRANVSNAYGSELLGLVMPIAVEYWNGAAYVKSTDDSISNIAVTLGNYRRNLNAGETLATVTPLVAGVGQVRLTAPGANNNGSVEVSATAPAYLSGNTARATFGVYKGPFIYMREQY